MTRSRPTSADVAARAGVSRTTVSFVLNEKAGAQISSATRERVLTAAAELGYHPHGPARQLAAGRSHVIGLVLRQSPEQVAGDPFLVEMLGGLSLAARSQRFRVLVEPLTADDTYEALLRSQHADGLIVSGPRTDDPSLERVLRDGFPIVLQGTLPGLDVTSVDVDNVASAHAAVDHLLALGHRRIACVTNAPLVYTAARERLQGYREALAAAGIAPDPDLVAEGAIDAPSGHAAMAGLLARGSFTAAFVASDVVALGAIGAIREAGLRVPQDISVIGFDDVPLVAYFDPPLTTIRVPAFDLGQAAGHALLERIAAPNGVTRTLLPTALVVRASTAPPRSPPSSGDP